MQDCVQTPEHTPSQLLIDPGDTQKLCYPADDIELQRRCLQHAERAHGQPPLGAILTSTDCSVVKDDIGLQLRSLHHAEQTQGKPPSGAILTSTYCSVVAVENLQCHGRAA